MAAASHSNRPFLIASATNLSLDALQHELAQAEQNLEQNERQRLAAPHDGPSSVPHQTPPEPLSERLARLEATAQDLALTIKVAKWKEQYMARLEDDDPWVEEVVAVERLKDLCLEHADSVDVAGPCQSLILDDILPYCEYLHDELKHYLRRLLQRADYPSPGGCIGLLEQKGTEGSDYHSIVAACQAIYRIASTHEQLAQQLQFFREIPLLDVGIIVREFCRPFVQRVDFHFMQQQVPTPGNPKQTATNSRVDRLPEWICAYIREHALESGPWDLIESLASSLSVVPGGSVLALDYLNELNCLIQWALGERNFFRHPVIAGPESNPKHLITAIEQFLQYDAYTQTLLGLQTDRLLTLMDVFIGGDDELLSWWLEREREHVFSTLLHEDVTLPLVSRISPRAELFCSIIRSVQSKASAFSFSGPYLSAVAAPLCSHFVDAVDESSASLRAQLGARQIPSDAMIEANINEWIELINGTHMAALVLGSDEEDESESGLGGDQDLARFGRSLQSLEAVLVDEFTKVLVGTVIMERAKLASYLVRCPHLLSSEEDEIADFATLPTELEAVRHVLSKFIAVCDNREEIIVEGEADSLQLSQHACKVLKEGVLDALANKLLEVALNLDEMTPDLHLAGCIVFKNDVESLFASSLVPPTVLRLLDIVRFMSMPADVVSSLGNALCGLVGRAAPLEIDFFAADERLYDEAMSMANAKGLLWLDLADILNVLNRRRDLIHKTA